MKSEFQNEKVRYKNMSNTMSQFKETVFKIEELRTREKMIIENFKKSTCELSEVFHYILNAELKGRKQICLGLNTCPELYAKELKGMGFEIEENRNIANTLCGYCIRWK